MDITEDEEKNILVKCSLALRAWHYICQFVNLINWYCRKHVVILHIFVANLRYVTRNILTNFLKISDILKKFTANILEI